VTPICEPLGAHSHCQSVRQQIETYLGAYEDRLLEEIRVATGPAREHGEAFIGIAAAFRDALGEEKQAQTLRRRGEVAAKA
ncbi:MAG: hypothetical protein K9G30_07440, partial [Parvibaculum sp.]|nr:hypothetical protein [Parvibaculum sp.]